jgi:uncharacterized protein
MNMCPEDQEEEKNEDQEKSRLKGTCARGWCSHADHDLRQRQGRGRRGRNRCLRRISNVPEVTFFKPAGVELRESNTLTLNFNELEALKLVDLEGLTQEEAATKMGVSRRTFWKDLQEARKKVVTALTKGYAIRIQGGDFLLPDGDDEEGQ